MSFYNFILKKLYPLNENENQNCSKKTISANNNNLWVFGISLIVSTVLLFVYSKNSIIYEMNDYCDENNFFSITDSMFHGMVLYKDIFEHKGPFLFLLYSLIHILGNSYFTLYIFECITNALYIYFGTKIILLYDKDATRVRIFMYALCLEFCLCTATSFMMGGVPEELFLWMSSCGLYITLRCIKHEQYYLGKDVVLIGMLCGALFWTKYSLLGFYSGLTLCVILWNLINKKIKKLGNTILLFFTGFTISSIPTLIYSLITQNFSDMVDIYFVGNIFGKHGIWSYTAHLYHLLHIIYKDIAVFVLILLGLFYVVKNEQKSTKLLYIVTIVSSFLASCCLKVFWVYYPMPMLLFIPFGILAAKKLKLKYEHIFPLLFIIIIHFFISDEFTMVSPVIGDHINPVWLREHVRVLIKAAIILLILIIIIMNKKEFEKHRRFILYISMLALCIVASQIIRDPYFFTEQPLPQIRFKEIIQQVDNANILIYGTIDHGFIKSSRTYPQIKYFCGMDLVTDDTEKEQLNYIKNEIVDFIITPVKPQKMEEIVLGTSYHLIDTAPPYFFNGNTITFYLYKKLNNYEELK